MLALPVVGTGLGSRKPPEFRLRFEGNDLMILLGLLPGEYGKSQIMRYVYSKGTKREFLNSFRWCSASECKQMVDWICWSSYLFQISCVCCFGVEVARLGITLREKKPTFQLVTVSSLTVVCPWQRTARVKKASLAQLVSLLTDFGTFTRMKEVSPRYLLPGPRNQRIAHLHVERKQPWVHGHAAAIYFT